MTNFQRRLEKLEAVLTDSMGFVPHTQKWLEYWDRQYYLFLSAKDESTIRLGSVAEYRAVMKNAEESPASLVGRFLEEDRVREDHLQATHAASAAPIGVGR
jgi:hypothetical protein